MGAGHIKIDLKTPRIDEILGVLMLIYMSVPKTLQKASFFS